MHAASQGWLERAPTEAYFFTGLPRVLTIEVCGSKSNPRYQEIDKAQILSLCFLFVSKLILITLSPSDWPHRVCYLAMVAFLAGRLVLDLTRETLWCTLCMVVFSTGYHILSRFTQVLDDHGSNQLF